MATKGSYEDFRILHQSVLNEIKEKGVSKDGTIPGMLLYHKNELTYQNLGREDRTRAHMDMISALEEVGLSPLGVKELSKSREPLALAETAEHVLAVIERSAQLLARQERGM